MHVKKKSGLINHKEGRKNNECFMSNLQNLIQMHNTGTIVIVHKTQALVN